MPPTIDTERYRKLLQELDPLCYEGKVAQVIGLTIEAEGLNCEIGEVCAIRPQRGGEVVQAEVVGFRRDRVVLMPLGEMRGIRPGTRVLPTGLPFRVRVGSGLLGRVIDGLGRPIDHRGPIQATRKFILGGRPPDPLTRLRIREALPTGVRAMDGLLTCGKGQRIGIFAGSGVGKSTLLGMIARRVSADINVIALIGERGREVREFIERDLGSEGLARSVVVVSTSDQPALVRLRGAWVATAVAEHFREQGLDVNFMMDSLTRFAMAEREIGLTVGEPPTARGYTPSVFALLPKLLERAGTGEHGTITAFYTVLVESDDLNEPVADAVRGILDGHIVLSRDLAAAGHYPAIDVLSSISRLMPEVTSTKHQAAAAKLRETLATHKAARDLLNIGAYQTGSDPRVDYAVQVMPEVTTFLRQEPNEEADYQDTVTRLQRMMEIA